MIRIFKAAALCAASALLAVSLAASCTPRHARGGGGPKDAVKPKQEVNLVYSPETGRNDYGDLAVEAEKRFADSLRKAEFEQEDIEEAIIRRAEEEARREAERPVAGGKATVYLQRGFLDGAMTELSSADPFGREGSEHRLFDVTDSTRRRLEFTLARPIKRANGRKATALDFVELWSRLLKERPARGLALFRYVQGAEDYVNGKEPLVSGLSAADERTIRIRLAKPDQFAFQRLRSPDLVGAAFTLGPYYAAWTAADAVKLVPNANSVSEDTAYLAECVVKFGSDPDAMASFAKGKYAAMTIYSAADVETARTELEGKAALIRLPSDRYFLACKSANNQLRAFIRGAVSGMDMLKNVVKAEGEEIFSVTSHEAPAGQKPTRAPPPELPKPMKLIYRSDDPISTVIAEKLRDDFAAAGLPTDAAGGDAETYEKTLVSGRYDCAVGWAPEAVLNSLTEQLHFASMWFADEADARVRLGEYREIPLFSVNNYMLLREGTTLYRGRIGGMWSRGK
ncbi:hypothetical protein R80B4_03229 [Fibrobacteres bacterium R8-0-B4]